jgi:hypothetical protein
VLKLADARDNLAIVMRTIICLIFAALVVCTGLHAEEKVDLYTINRIKHEAFDNSKLMENAFYLTDVYGPRLTGSPGIQAAGEWVVRKANEWGWRMRSSKSGGRSGAVGIARGSSRT